MGEILLDIAQAALFVGALAVLAISISTRGLERPPSDDPEWWD